MAPQQLRENLTFRQRWPPITTAKSSRSRASLHAVELGDGQQGDESGMEQIGQLWQNNYGGGYLRGRGRGRPKLIGDELDAELVEYIVQLKQTNPRAHITAAQALVIARKYIAEKAPGLLEENGGQVKLKITWAMNKEQPETVPPEVRRRPQF
uniref:Uncharacterized protein n=1 Tax=Globodera pallida TaxID=36090 RepID=A0A183BT43_GLOPA